MPRLALFEADRARGLFSLVIWTFAIACVELASGAPAVVFESKQQEEGRPWLCSLKSELQRLTKPAVVNH